MNYALHSLSCVSVFVLAMGFATTSASAHFECDGIAPVPGEQLEAPLVITATPSRPLLMVSPPGDRDRFFIVGQDGQIRLWKRGSAPDESTLFLDIGSRVNTFGNETGLLGLAFDPDFDTNGHFYVNYTEGSFFDVGTVVARYDVSATDPDVADPASEVRILSFDQPQSNHNGGQIYFGPDGYLYVATGDGGGAGDQFGACGNGQNVDTLLGKLLRIDVRDLPGSLPPECGVDTNYEIPADNPFAGSVAGCGEIHSYGLRNPWRSAFDPADGSLFVADVGQDCWEEVNWLPSEELLGANYGWRQMEGSQCYNSSGGGCDPPGVSCGSSPDCNDPSLVLPIVDVAHSSGACSITGGEVYRGCRMPDLSGTYFYGDFCQGFIRTLRVAGGVAVDERDVTEDLFGPGGFVPDHTGFGLDAEGEIYIVSQVREIYKLTPPFAGIEVSGPGAADLFLLGESAWTWEDVNFTTMVPLASSGAYRVYRGLPNDEFTCIQATSEPTWVGDAESPQPGELFAYLVTAVDERGVESSPGEPTSARSLSSAPCPGS